MLERREERRESSVSSAMRGGNAQTSAETSKTSHEEVLLPTCFILFHPPPSDLHSDGVIRFRILWYENVVYARVFHQCHVSTKKKSYPIIPHR